MSRVVVGKIGFPGGVVATSVVSLAPGRAAQLDYRPVLRPGQRASVRTRDAAAAASRSPARSARPSTPPNAARTSVDRDPSTSGTSIPPGTAAGDIWRIGPPHPVAPPEHGVRRAP